MGKLESLEATGQWRRRKTMTQDEIFVKAMKT